MKLRCFTVGLFQVNAWLIEDPATGACALVDTGESDEVARALARLDPRPDLRAILLTHAHFDHAGGLVPLQALYPQAETVLPRLERPLFELLPRQGEMFGAAQFSKPCGRIDRDVDDGDTVTLTSGDFSIQVPDGFDIEERSGVYVMSDGEQSISYSRTATGVSSEEFLNQLLAQIGGDVVSQDADGSGYTAEVDRDGARELIVIRQQDGAITVATGHVPEGGSLRLADLVDRKSVV